MEQMSVRPGLTFLFIFLFFSACSCRRRCSHTHTHTHTAHHLFRRRNNSLVTAATYAFRAPLIKRGFAPRASKAGGICCQKRAEPASQKMRSGAVGSPHRLREAGRAAFPSAARNNYRGNARANI